MEGILEWIADPAVRDWYLVFCMAIMVLPMIALTWWYHSNIHDTEGGQKLMRRQARTPPRLNRFPVVKKNLVREVTDMARDIAAGVYGITARMMQYKVYWVVGFWLLANVIAFGLLIWADEVNRGAA